MLFGSTNFSALLLDERREYAGQSYVFAACLDITSDPVCDSGDDLPDHRFRLTCKQSELRRRHPRQPQIRRTLARQDRQFLIAGVSVDLRHEVEHHATKQLGQVLRGPMRDAAQRLR